MFLDIVKAFGEIVDISFKLKDRLSPDFDREGTSTLLLQISELLEHVTLELEARRYPFYKCGEMHFYMKAFQGKLEGKMTTEEVEYLSNLINECYQVERLLGELNNLTPIEKEMNLNKLKEASGQFRAASELIKVK